MRLRAIETAKRGAWRTLSKGELVRQVRALLLASLRAATLSPYEPEQLGYLDGRMYSTAERNAAASALARTVVLLAPPVAFRATRDIVTDGANHATGQIEVGLPPVAVVVLGTLAALAAAFVGSSIASAIVVANFDNNVTKRLLAIHARALEIMALHVERERLVGHELPFDEAEISLLRALEEQQRTLATMQGRPLPSPFRGATEFVQATTAASTSFLPIAIIGLIAFFLIQHNGGKRHGA
ncbi:MAG: hypothetical protein IPM54_41130 [Polyangiaceae bacterium]|nr:hypothetical protein [Polyangiaceae bacterium]